MNQMTICFNEDSSAGRGSRFARDMAGTCFRNNAYS